MGEANFSNAAGVTQGSRILLVEDEAIISLDLAATLAQLGYDVINCVTSGEAAIEQALVLRPALILMDIRLNGKVDGIEAAREIKKHIDVAIVFLTSHSDDATLNRAKTTAPGGYLLKPFKIPELRCAIEVALHNHKTEVALVRSEERYRNLVDNSPALICTHDLKGMFLSLNPAAAQKLGYPIEECVGKNISEFIAPDKLEKFVPYLAEIQQGPAVSGTLHVIGKNEKRQIWMFNNCLVQFPGIDPYVLAHAQDVTELIETQKELDQSHRELLLKTREIDSFYHSVSHELKTPLTAATEFVSLVMDGVAGPVSPVQAEYLAVAKESCAQLALYINDLLDATRAETQKFEVKLARMNLVEMVQRTMVSIKPKAMAKGINLHLTAREQDYTVKGDARRLNQVLANLLSNAIRYTPDNGEIRLDIEWNPEKAGLVVVTVKDPGPGIAPENLERIFERLFQVGKKNTAEGGLGLGLFISRQIIEAHGGAIWAESVVGEGTTFKFSLQIADEAPVASLKAQHLIAGQNSV